jgi:NADH dehydrogenase
MAGALHELFSMVLARDFPRLDVSQARIVVLEATDRLLGAFSESSRSYALRKLASMGVDVRLGATVAAVGRDAVRLADGAEIPTATTIWVAGVRASPLADALGLPQDRGGRVVVGADLSVPGHPHVHVIGDLAAARMPDGALYPQLAPVAMQQARFVARRIRAGIEGTSAPGVFRYVDRGTMATIGRNRAVAELPLHVRIRGFPAWVAWLFLHLLYLAGFRNRANVLVNWAWNYLTWDRGARLIVAAAADPSTDLSGEHRYEGSP